MNWNAEKLLHSMMHETRKGKKRKGKKRKGKKRKGKKRKGEKIKERKLYADKLLHSMLHEMKKGKKGDKQQKTVRCVGMKEAQMPSEALAAFGFRV